MKDVLVKADWFEQIKNAPKEIQKELFYRVIKLGVFEEEIDTSNDDWAIADSWKNLSGNIIRMQDAYDKKANYGKTHGKKMNGDPQLIYDYLQEHPKASVTEIGEAFDLPKTGNVKGPYSYLYENPGWKSRKIPNWCYENSKLELENGKNLPELESDLELELEKFSKKENSNLENSSGKFDWTF